MQWFRKQNTFLRVCITLALIMPVILIPIFSVMWTARNAHASQAGLSGLPRPHSATPQAPNTSLASVWTSHLYFAASADGGQSWSAPLAMGAGPQDYWAAPVVDWNGSIFVFYSGAPGMEMIRSSNNGQTWSYTGSPGSPFQTSIDLANFGDTAAQVTLTLSLTSSTNAHSIKTYQTTVAPQSSVSVWLNPIVCPTGVTYCGQSVATQVTATQPVVADRQMFFNYGGNTPGATATVGSASGPQSTVYFAEGYTRAGFTEYLTFVNPANNTGNESVTVRYLIQGGATKTFTIAQLQPGQRWTELVNRDIGPNRSVSVVVTSSGGTLIVERPMYFHFHAMAFGGSDVIGYSPGD